MGGHVGRVVPYTTITVRVPAHPQTWPHLTRSSGNLLFVCVRSDEIRFLTVRQPFASGLVLGYKWFENRSQAPHQMSSDCRAPVWIGIHASSQVATDKEYPILLPALRAAWPEMPPVERLPKSAILGFVHVAESVPPIPNEPQAVGPECWVLDGRIPLSSPICDVRGNLGLWKHQARVPAGAT